MVEKNGENERLSEYEGGDILNYRDVAKEHESFMTGIHTRITEQYRLSSTYRRFANAYFESWGWETLLWDGDRIYHQYDVLNTAEQVVNLHTKVFWSYCDDGELYLENK